jgi:hypothetical protein
VTEPVELRGGRSSQVDQLGVFAVLWAVAAVWHLLGNASLAPGWAQAALAVAAGVVLLLPGEPLALAGLAAAGVVTAWEEAPTIGNHWVLAALVNLGILLAVGVGALRGRPRDRLDLANRALPVARLSLLGFYAFAAFSKLNSAFFDRSVSCGAYYFRESTSSLGLSALQLDGAAWVEQAVIIGTVVIELTIPVLLVRRATRNTGVVVALVFHGLLALDRSHQFFDFSSLLAALFVLFLPPMASSWVAERIGSIRARLALRHEGLPARVHLVLAGLPVAAGLLVALDVLSPREAVLVGWWPWQAMAIALVIAVGIYLWRRADVGAPSRLAPHHALFALVPLLVVLNGLTPYLELKTGFGWNMYANLRTVDGETNHLLLPGTLPLTDEQADLVEIVSSSDPALAAYAANEHALTWNQLRSYLADHPDTQITYRRAGRRIELARADDNPSLVEPLPLWREKLQLFRAVDLTEPERCLPSFGAAR